MSRHLATPQLGSERETNEKEKWTPVKKKNSIFFWHPNKGDLDDFCINDIFLTGQFMPMNTSKTNNEQHLTVNKRLISKETASIIQPPSAPTAVLQPPIHTVLLI